MGFFSKLFGVQEVLTVTIECSTSEGRVRFIPHVPLDSTALQKLLVQSTALVYGQLHFSLFGSAFGNESLLREAGRIIAVLDRRASDTKELLQGGQLVSSLIRGSLVGDWSANVMGKAGGELGIRSKMLRFDDDPWIEDLLQYAVAACLQQLDVCRRRQLRNVLQGMNEYYLSTGNFQKLNGPTLAMEAGMMWMAAIEEGAAEVSSGQAESTPFPGAPPLVAPKHERHAPVAPEDSGNQRAGPEPAAEPGNIAKPGEGQGTETSDNPAWETKCPTCGELLEYQRLDTSEESVFAIEAKCRRCSIMKTYRMFSTPKLSQGSDTAKYRGLSCIHCGYLVVGGRVMPATKNKHGVVLVETNCPRCNGLKLLEFAQSESGSLCARKDSKGPPEDLDIKISFGDLPDLPKRLEPVDFSKATKVNSVQEEHLLIGRAMCDACGGALRHSFQSLVVDPESGTPYDDVITQCANCGAHQFFLFEVSAAFSQYIEEQRTDSDE